MSDVINYYVESFDIAKGEGWPAPHGETWEEISEWGDLDWSFGVWRAENGTIVEFIGADGGEPEDATLNRSFSWVRSALSDAYLLGLRRGKQHA